MDTSSPRIRSRQKAELFWGIYEGSEGRLASRSLDPRLDVVELGSSIGVTTCEIRRRMEPVRKLMAVEADPQLIPILRRTLELNGFGQGVQVINRAISYQDATALFEQGSGNTVGRVVSRPADAVRPVEVKSATLGELLDEFRLGRYALVADIEGAEVDVFLHDRGALSRCSQVIIELHAVRRGETHYTIEDLAGMIVACGFTQRARLGNVFLFDADSLALPSPAPVSATVPREPDTTLKRTGGFR